MWPALDIAPQNSSVVAWLQQRSPGLRQLTLEVSVVDAPAGTADLLQSCVARPGPVAASLRYGVAGYKHVML